MYVLLYQSSLAGMDDLPVVYLAETDVIEKAVNQAKAQYRYLIEPEDGADQEMIEAYNFYLREIPEQVDENGSVVALYWTENEMMCQIIQAKWCE